jgi:DNA polymerase-3 subunit epsilon
LLFDLPIAFVDLETTGANPVADRVIEVGIVKVVGGVVEYEWQTLVDPEVPIPPLIQGFTGIRDDMVRGAPTFSALAEEIAERIGDSLFVAHNARFDLGFLKNEFRRIGWQFAPRVLCTVKLSRALYPQHHRHGLDAILARHGLACDARHRALGDARVLWDFVQLVRREHGPDVVEQAAVKAMKQPSLPPNVGAETLDLIPDTPGVYLFYGENDLPLYIGKSVSLRSRVRSHVTGDHSAGRAMRMTQEIRRVDWIETAGEFGALLLEARLIKEKMPIHNRKLRREGELCSWRIRENAAPGDVAVELVGARDLDPRDIGMLHGLFRSKREATNTLRELASAHQLCPRRLGLESGRGACFASQLRKCKGVCVGRESTQAHDLRLRTALAVLRLKTWPYPGRIAIREADADRGREVFHLFDAWCYLGSESSQGDLFDATQARIEPQFDLDTYRILSRYLAGRPANLVLLGPRASPP